MRPTVATSPSPPRASASAASSSSAAAASASCRSAIGTVPACPLAPRHSTCTRLCPQIAGHDAHRELLALEHGALLDVQLDVAERRAGARGGRHAVGAAARRLQRLGEGHAVGVTQLQPGALERAGVRAAAEVRDAEADALLVGEGEHLDGERQAQARCRQPLDAGDAGEHAERAVVAARVGHRVEVRAHEQRGGVRARTLVAADACAERVSPHRHACLAHPAGHALHRRLERGRGDAPGDPPVLLAARRERVAARHHPRRARVGGPSASAAAVRAVGPGRGEQRHVVVRAGVGDRRPHRNPSRNGGASPPARRSTRRREHQLVGPGHEAPRPRPGGASVRPSALVRARATSSRPPRQRSTPTPAAGRPWAVSSTCVVSRPFTGVRRQRDRAVGREGVGVDRAGLAGQRVARAVPGGEGDLGQGSEAVEQAPRPSRCTRCWIDSLTNRSKTLGAGSRTAAGGDVAAPLAPTPSAASGSASRRRDARSERAVAALGQRRVVVAHEPRERAAGQLEQLDPSARSRGRRADALRRRPASRSSQAMPRSSCARA